MYSTVYTVRDPIDAIENGTYIKQSYCINYVTINHNFSLQRGFTCQFCKNDVNDIFVKYHMAYRIGVTEHLHVMSVDEPLSRYKTYKLTSKHYRVILFILHGAFTMSRRSNT